MRLKLAEQIGIAALAHAAKTGVPPLAIIVLDAGGNLKYAAIQDGAGTLRHTIAIAKASAAIGMGVSTRELHTLFERGLLPDHFATAISAAAPKGFAPQPGGELIHRQGELVGAIGVSGAASDVDESVARFALSSVGA